MSICLAYYTLIIDPRELRHGPETGAIDIRSIEVSKEGLIAGSHARFSLGSHNRVQPTAAALRLGPQLGHHGCILDHSWHATMRANVKRLLTSCQEMHLSALLNCTFVAACEACFEVDPDGWTPLRARRRVN